MYEETVETGNKALDKYPHQVSSAIELVASDLSMVEEFLNIEIDLLRHAGFEEYAIEKLSKQTRMRLEHLRLHKPSNAVSASELKRQIARMQNHICQQSDKCEKALKDSGSAFKLLVGFSRSWYYCSKYCGNDFNSSINVQCFQRQLEVT